MWYLEEKSETTFDALSLRNSRTH